MANIRKALKSFRLERTRSETSSTHVDVGQLTIAEFKKRDLIVLVRSLLFDDNIYLVSNPNCIQHTKRNYACYLPDEMSAMLAFPPEALKQIHELKKTLDGEIISAASEIG